MSNVITMQEEKMKREESRTYKQEEITFTNGGITLSGTLTLPNKAIRHPAVVLKTGSGPLNRDGTHPAISGFKPFWIIADHLTRKGIAVLRYDSRGVGGSMGNVWQSTIFDFAEDVLSAVRYLKTRNDIDHARIGICGHSEGAVVASLAASRSDDIVFITCISGGGLTGEEFIITQKEHIARASGITEGEIAEYSGAYKYLFHLIRTGESEAEIKSEITKILRMEMNQVKGGGILHRLVLKFPVLRRKYIASHVNCILTQFNSPWSKHLLDYDPKPVLEKIKCPVLLLFGELDLQVPIEINRKAMVDALRRGGNNDYSVKIFPGANHLFQKAITGIPNEYPNLAKEFVPGFLECISEWILNQLNSIIHQKPRSRV